VTLVAWKDGLVAAPLEARVEPGPNEIVLSLRRGAAFVGRVTDRATALPVEGAAISIWTVAELDRVLSGPDGWYRFPRFLVDGRHHQMRFEAPGYGGEVRYLRIDEDGSWSSPALFPGAPVEGDVGFPARLDASLVLSTQLRGTIAGVDGAPIEGALATALGRFYIEADVAASDRASAVTDASGEFSLPGLRSDIGHVLRLEAPGYARADLTVPASSDPVRDLGALYLEVQAVLGGVVADPTGLPGEDASVFLEWPAPDASAEASRGSPRDAGLASWLFRERVRTDKAGTFIFEGLAPGAYRLSVRRDMGVLAELEVEVRAGELRHDLEIALPPESHTLFGEVAGPRGPAAGATVTLSRYGEIGTFSTDAEGRFYVAGLDAAGGEYDLTAGWTDPKTGARYESSASVASFAAPRIELQPAPDASTPRPGKDGDH
jgi:protocatechuate 3,4-dioxygenase beta subunit